MSTIDFPRRTRRFQLAPINRRQELGLWTSRLLYANDFKERKNRDHTTNANDDAREINILPDPGEPCLRPPALFQIARRSPMHSIVSGLPLPQGNY